MRNLVLAAVAGVALLAMAGSAAAQQTLCQKYDAWMAGSASKSDGGKLTAVSDQMSLEFDSGNWNGRDTGGKGPFFGQAEVTTCTPTSVEFKVQSLGSADTCKLDDKGGGTCTAGTDTRTLQGKFRVR